MEVGIYENSEIETNVSRNSETGVTIYENFSRVKTEFNKF